MSLWPSGGLWRHPDFIRLWSAETVSQFGSQFSLLIIGGIGSCLPFLPVLLSPLRQLRDLPPLVDDDIMLEPLLADATAVTVQHPGA
jgi:hypothetical protein